MRKLRRHLLSLLLLSALPSFLFAAVTPAPNLNAVTNFSGPVLVFWDPGGTPSSNVQYFVFIATNSMMGKTTSQLLADSLVTGYQAATYSAGKNSYEFRFTGTENEKQYFARIAAYDPATDDWSALSTQLGAISRTERPFVESMSASIPFTNAPLDGVSYVLDYDSQTFNYSFSLRGESGSPFLPPARVQVDIQSSAGVSILAETFSLPVNVVYSSSSFSATCVVSTWTGAVGSGDKHNGTYKIVATPLDKSDSAITMGRKVFPVTVDVVHINSPVFVLTAYGTSKHNYGPPFYFDYYPSKDCFVTWKIWDRHQTADPMDDTLVRVVVSTAPRVTGDGPDGWNKMLNEERWDGRNDQGLIVPNDIYRCTIDAIEYWGEPGELGFNPAITDRCITVTGTISYDVLRLVDVGSTGITDTSSLAHLKYTLGGANSAMGGATIKLVICSPGTTFYMAAGSGSISYLSGAGTYNYAAGDPLPNDTSRIKKVFVFQRSAGILDETWNGYDEAGNALPNDNYVFAISATDDSGNHAIDNSGNDRAIVGNVTIDRTAGQVAGDSTPPTVTAIAVNGTTILTGGGSTLTSAFSTIVIQMQDTGGSGVDLVNSTVTLTGPSSSFIGLTATNNGTDTLTLTFGNQTTNGAYTLRIRPRDKVGNTASDVVCSFTLNIPASGASSAAAAFESSIIAYPNPAKGANAVTFSYTAPAVTTLKLEVYSILGELVYEEQWGTASGAQTKTWNIVNKAQKRLASGMYLYRLTDQNSANKPKKLRKLIVIQ